MVNSLSASELVNAIQSSQSIDELKKLVADSVLKKAINEDGSIRGLHYCAASGKRGAVLQASINRGKPGGFTTSMIVDGKDFKTVYFEMVRAIAAHYELKEGSSLIAKMHESVDVFLKKNGLQLQEVRYEQVSKIGS